MMKRIDIDTLVEIFIMLIMAFLTLVMAGCMLYGAVHLWRLVLGTP